LANDAMRMNATVLYADLADSTKLVDDYKDWFAVAIYILLLHCAAKIIRSENGAIMAYDGDRIMAVFDGDDRNADAVRAALKINFSAQSVIKPAKERYYPGAESEYVTQNVTGIDTSDLAPTDLSISSPPSPSRMKRMSHNRITLYLLRSNFILSDQTLFDRNTHTAGANKPYSTVTDLARLRGLSTSVPRARAV
jgi:hypothetical protein